MIRSPGYFDTDGMISRAESVAAASSADHSTRSMGGGGSGGLAGNLPPSLAMLGRKLSGGFTNRNDDNSSLDQNFSNYSKLDKNDAVYGDMSMNGSTNGGVDASFRHDSPLPVTVSPMPAGSGSLFKQVSFSKMMGLGRMNSGGIASVVASAGGSSKDNNATERNPVSSTAIHRKTDVVEVI